MTQMRIAHIIIAVVLACPYLCMGESSGSASAMCETGCGCSQNQPEPESPGEPADHDPDCLCRGAVVDGEVRTDDFDLSSPQTISCRVIDTPSVSTDSGLTSLSFEPSNHFPPFCTGKDVCVLTCTLLI